MILDIFGLTLDIRIYNIGREIWIIYGNIR